MIIIKRKDNINNKKLLVLKVIRFILIKIYDYGGEIWREK